MNRRQERGSILVITAASLIALLGLAALVVDLGDSRQRTRENQSVSDMAALAAATDLSSNAGDTAAQATAHSTAASYVASNLGSTLAGASCRTATSGMQCYTDGDAYIEISTPYAGVAGVPSHQQVHINVCSQSPGFFAPAIGATPSEVCRAATATLDETIVVIPAVLALDPSGPEAFHLEGAARAVGLGGSLVSNSTSSSAFHMKDSTNASASAAVSGTSSCICAVGQASINGSATVSPAAAGGSAVVNDPWATLAEPVAQPAGGYNSGTKTWAAGSHGSITIDKPGTYTFAPGIHEFTGQFKIEGANVYIVAEDVLWYFANGSSANWGSGTNYIRISAMGPGTYYGGNSGAFPPVAIFQARSNTDDFNIGDNIQIGNVSGGTCTVDGTAGITGGVYLPTSELRVRGNSNSGICTDGAPIVAFRVQIQETGFVQGGTDGASGTSTRATFLSE